MRNASLSARRAWIEIPAGCWRESRRVSLSARRAWIEIQNHLLRTIPRIVALRKESVDRNSCALLLLALLCVSLSARRAWIEMSMAEICQVVSPVALRKESVDRNFPGTNTILYTIGRSPQGERG